MENALKLIAELAPTLSHTEVRVLLELSRRVAATAGTQTAASSRDLATACNLSRRNVQSALDSLNRRQLITSDRGSATGAATHTVVLKPEVPLGRGANFAPPPVEKVALFQRHPGANLAPPLAQFSRHPGAENAPPLIQRASGADAFGDFDSIKNQIDRMLEAIDKAKPTDYAPEMRQRAANLMRSYQAKFTNGPTPEPDEEICARFLAVAEEPRLQGMIWDLLAERKKPGDSYAWYVTVATQRILGITPQQQKDFRERKTARRKPPTQQQQIALTQAAAAGSFATAANAPDLANAIREAAQRKALR